MSDWTDQAIAAELQQFAIAMMEMNHRTQFVAVLAEAGRRLLAMTPAPIKEWERVEQWADFTCPVCGGRVALIDEPLTCDCGTTYTLHVFVTSERPR